MPVRNAEATLAQALGSIMNQTLNAWELIAVDDGSTDDTAAMLEEFSRRDKGPLWIVFPYDSGAEYQTELVFGWSIWQLATLTIAE